MDTTSQRKLTWSELKEVIGELRRQLSSLSSIVPSNISFRNLIDGRVRIYFLSTPQNGWESTLLYADVPHEFPTTVPKLQWHCVIESNFPSMSSNPKYSKEEQLLWERKRLATWGINSYELHAETGKIIFPANSSLFQCTDLGYTHAPIFSSKLRLCNSSGGAKLSASMCPWNADLVAYVCDQDLWVGHAGAGGGARLTYAHKGGGRGLVDDPLSAAVPSYVIQEEFNRYHGYWWQPQCTDGVYRILYEEVDDSDVKIFCCPSSQSSEGGGGSVGGSNTSGGGACDVDEFRFPRAGCANSKSQLKIVEFKVGHFEHKPGIQAAHAKQIIDIVHLELQFSPGMLFPSTEYVVRAGWTPDATNVWVQLLDRRQQRLELVLFSLANFTEVLPMYEDESGGLQALGGGSAVQVIYIEQCLPGTWINVHDLLHFVPPIEGVPPTGAAPDEIQFIWASEETGFRHLYLVQSKITPPFDPPNNGVVTTRPGDVEAGPGSPLATPQQDDALQSPLRPNIVSKIALTSGEWEVLGQSLWVDLEMQLVYFMSLRETVLEKHLYVVSFQRPGHVRLLTTPGFSYICDFNKECTMLVAVYSSLEQIPCCQVFRITHLDTTVEGVELRPLGYLQEQSPPQPPDPDLTPTTQLAPPSSPPPPPMTPTLVTTALEGGQQQMSVNPAYCPVLYARRIASGEELYAMVFRPHEYVGGGAQERKYPVVLYVYAGPEVQLVNNTFKGMRYLRLHMLASRGYCVVAIDSRGSQHRGIQFESHLRCRMGTVELQDQIEVLNWLGQHLTYLDLERVAIHGWSYGGYMSLMGLAQRSDVFRVAVAGAPVTDWSLYDTGYTERYMDLPENNTQGYTDGSVTRYVNKFPDEENRLLIIHGLIDENVHFCHTSQLINALIKAGKPYQLQVYPNERHSLRHLDASKHYETTLLTFLQNHL